MTSPPAPPRPRAQRKQDTLARLGADVDAWVATAGGTGGTPYLVPLSFLWDGETLLLATPAQSPTGRNMGASGRVRIAVGPTRDVVLIEGAAEPLSTAELPAQTLDAFAAKTGFDPREEAGFRYYRVRPERIQAWREVEELAERDLMSGGRWLV
ncbi:pyridoxamine 5'-phosphate oxidase family protein [Streptomonospora sp. PA3]|uniref:pyridoxamine 5'-phosphate oxidase family protein n=1 Tax=Streptomonospora sp. PA3 TaxID=2607326 RepID=UPI0012DCD9AF|nr:pyridoxamine 5'-phosphate oxidase family protein [Streptomonospora sp. PA3]MUL41120.1 pyridoxamine 5'-phosphate oxidase family protein [Streptomonospora sp. PA3]